MPNVALYNIAGEEIGKVKLSEEIFGHEVNEAVLHTVVTAYLANQRQGTQSALTRAEVSGGGIKPWRQKGTGRRRQGSTRSPPRAARRRTRRQHRVDRSAQEPDEIVIAGLGSSLTAPKRETAHIDAEGQHDRRAGHHRLTEVARRQLLPNSRIGRHDDAVHLHITRIRGSDSGLENPLQQPLVDRVGLITSHRAVPENRFDHVFRDLWPFRRIANARRTPFTNIRYFFQSRKAFSEKLPYLQ